MSGEWLRRLSIELLLLIRIIKLATVLTPPQLSSIRRIFSIQFSREVFYLLCLGFDMFDKYFCAMLSFKFTDEARVPVIEIYETFVS
jgi:hypothetical protein